MIYLAARDTFHMEVLMNVCTQWGAAMEFHPFWDAVFTLLAPQHVLQHSTVVQSPFRPTPYRRFRDLLAYACLPCRISAPGSDHGLGLGRRTVSCIPSFGAVVLCEEHYNPRRAGWCGICLMDREFERPVQRNMQVESCNTLEPRMANAGNGIVHNVDHDAFPGVHAICRVCRAERLWQGALHMGAELIEGAEELLHAWAERRRVLAGRRSREVAGRCICGLGNGNDAECA
ncbi:hypothetical protein B0H11DRAFT_2025115 [Mycena galericulata]|nr:hypothetical protein B0H11DRAFT_2095054 [Mycena galericulata]KAJ7480498.1 hypothetical protein B0H11DRAFT_2025115 [Mycena galericulata]